MKKTFLSFFMSVLLSACATAPAVPVPNGLWYADNEDPVSRYHVYVYFKDASRFIWWRTTEAQAVVFKRWGYYTHDHPGVDNPVIFTRTGDSLKGEQRLVNKNSERRFATHDDTNIYRTLQRRQSGNGANRQLRLGRWNASASRDGAMVDEAAQSSIAMGVHGATRAI